MKIKTDFDRPLGQINWNILLVLTAMALITLTGCGGDKSKINIRTVDEVILSTARVTAEEPIVTDRGWPEGVLYYENIAVEHETLYLKGSLEGRGSEDGYFKAWDRDSGFSAGVSPVIFVGKTFLLPISMILAPPWEKQYSRSGYPVVEPAYELPGEPSGMARLESKK